MDINEKVTAIQTLVSTFKTLGDEERIDSILTACRDGSQIKRTEKKQINDNKRGPYRTTVHKVLSEGPASISALVEKLEKLQYVPGKTSTEKQNWLTATLKKSPNTYRDYKDGAWGLRKEKNNN